jgi:hypothetical protein
MWWVVDSGGGHIADDGKLCQVRRREVMWWVVPSGSGGSGGKLQGMHGYCDLDRQTTTTTGLVSSESLAPTSVDASSGILGHRPLLGGVAPSPASSLAGAGVSGHRRFPPWGRRPSSVGVGLCYFVASLRARCVSGHGASVEVRAAAQ